MFFHRTVGNMCLLISTLSTKYSKFANRCRYKERGFWQQQTLGFGAAAPDDSCSVSRNIEWVSLRWTARTDSCPVSEYATTVLVRALWQITWTSETEIERPAGARTAPTTRVSCAHFLARFENSSAPNQPPNFNPTMLRRQNRPEQLWGYVARRLQLHNRPCRLLSLLIYKSTGFFRTENHDLDIWKQHFRVVQTMQQSVYFLENTVISCTSMLMFDVFIYFRRLRFEGLCTRRANINSLCNPPNCASLSVVALFTQPLSSCLTYSTTWG